MNSESLRQALRVHVMRLRQQHLRQQQEGSATASALLGCTVDELVHQVEGTLSADKADFGFGEALARLQALMAAPSATNNNAINNHRRGSLTGGSRRGSISEVIDAEAMVARHSLKSIA